MKRVLVVTPFNAYGKKQLLSFLRRNYDFQVDVVVFWEIPDEFVSIPYHKKRLLFLKCVLREMQEEYRHEYKTIYCPAVHFKTFASLPHADRENEVYAVDPLNSKTRIPKHVTIIPQLQFISDNQVTQRHIAKLKKGLRVQLQSFYMQVLSSESVSTRIPGLAASKYAYLRKSTDGENRGAMEQLVQAPQPKSFGSVFLSKCSREVEREYPNNPGFIEGIESLELPLTRTQAKKQLDYFVHKKLVNFGRYQDAIRPFRQNLSDVALFHSQISTSLNTGMLLPEEVVAQVVERSTELDIPHNSTEAFVRQVLGWREYCLLYFNACREHVDLATGFQQSKKLKSLFFKQVPEYLPEPVQILLNKAWAHAYLHHIERLYLLSFFIQLGVGARDIARWFRAFNIDSTQVVMDFNVCGMGYFHTQFTSKPYLFSSKYLVTQSNKDVRSDDLLDSLYWSFVESNRDNVRYVGRPPTKIKLPASEVTAFVQSLTK